MVIFRLLGAGFLFVVAVMLSGLFVVLSIPVAVDLLAAVPHVAPTATSTPSLPASLAPAMPMAVTPSPVPTVTLCDSSYPDFCIVPSSVDSLNCDDITWRGFRVLPPDPHKFDRDQDGIGCEP